MFGADVLKVGVLGDDVLEVDVLEVGAVLFTRI